MNTRPKVNASALEGTNWFASSYSNNGGNCIEVADLRATSHCSVAIRDSKDHEGPALLVTPGQFATFISFAARFKV